jgi:hypothetical protein
MEGKEKLGGEYLSEGTYPLPEAQLDRFFQADRQLFGPSRTGDDPRSHYP